MTSVITSFIYEKPSYCEDDLAFLVSYFLSVFPATWITTTMNNSGYTDKLLFDFVDDVILKFRNTYLSFIFINDLEKEWIIFDLLCLRFKCLYKFLR